VTVALAFAVFGEVLAPLQLLGGGLVLVAVLMLSGVGRLRLRWRFGGRRAVALAAES
jgi:drug/metabolite transporter (DMT)-like permease